MEGINAIATFIVALKQQGFRGSVVIGTKDRNTVVKLEAFVKVKDLKEFTGKLIQKLFVALDFGMHSNSGKLTLSGNLKVTNERF